MQQIVRTNGLSKHFGDVTALDTVSFEFESGIIYALLGPNGAGKTTLIRVLATLLKPDAGTAVVAGIDVLREAKTARTRIGLAGQFAAVDEYLTGREAVEIVGRLYNLSARESRKRASDVLERISLAPDADRLVRTYSGGMKRRLDLAASLVGRPQVLFLDEPTTGVDPRSRYEVWDLIKDLVRQGTTVLLTTQYLEEADQLADRIGVMDEGRLLTEGTGNELKDRLGGAVIQVDLRPGEEPAAIAALGLDEQATANAFGGSNVLRLPAPDGAQSLVEAIRRLDAARIAPTDIGLHRPTLDDVFLSLTGRKASSDQPAPPQRGRKRRREKVGAGAGAGRGERP
jgi:ABC-2 type transport system ATP-binding protein